MTAQKVKAGTDKARKGAKPVGADPPAPRVKGPKPTIRVVLPDAGPLISLAAAGALDLLLAFRAGVRLVLTDVVAYEVTHRRADLPDAAAIQYFIDRHRDRIEVMPTTIGSLALAQVERQRQGGQVAPLPRDLGELSITGFVISMRTVNPGEPTLVIVEDDWFESNTYALPGNVHLLSTAAWLDGLEALQVIESAAAVRARIQAVRPQFRVDHLVDREAGKIEQGTEWRSAMTPRDRGSRGS